MIVGVLFVLLFVGCQRQDAATRAAFPCAGQIGAYVPNIPECTLFPEKIVEGISDSIFFGWVSTFIVEGNRIYLPDETNARIVVADTAFRLVRMFGKKGRGPAELLQPMQMWLSGGWLWVFGAAGQGFVAYDTLGNVVAAQRMPVGKMLTRFFADDAQRLWVSVPGEVQGDILAFDTSGRHFWIESEMKHLEEKDKVQRGRFHLWRSEENAFWAFGETEPIMRKFSLNGALLAECDLRKSPVLEKFYRGLEVRKQQMDGDPSQMTFLLFQDVAMANPHTALLLMYSYDLEGEVYLDKVLVVDLDQCIIKGIYRLGTPTNTHPFFISMAFDPLSHRLYAFDNISSSFHVYKLSGEW